MLEISSSSEKDPKDIDELLTEMMHQKRVNNDLDHIFRQERAVAG